LKRGCAGFINWFNNRGNIMGTGVRVFFISTDNSVRKVPLTKFERLSDNRSDECFEEYAGERVRCAMVFVRLENRKPAEIIHVDYFIVPFKADGRVDLKERERGRSLVMRSLDLSISPDRKKVINAIPRILKKKYDEEFKWEPTDVELAMIVKKVFY
jgi:hypothetical protein